MTPEQLDELEALERAATPKMWDFAGVYGETGSAWLYEAAGVPGDPDLDDTRFGKARTQDAALIAAMRNAIPELIRMARFCARVTEQEKRLDELEQITKAECEKARAERDRYLAALKAEAHQRCDRENYYGETGLWAPRTPYQTEIGGITFRVSRKPDGSLEAEEVK